MPTRRFLLYAFAYFCAIIMYYFFIGWFAGFLLVVMAIVPLISILGSLPGMLSCHVGISADEYGRLGGNLVFKVSVRTKHGLLFGKSVVWYNVENSFTEEEYLKRRVKLFGADADETVTIAGLDSCGCVSITVKKVKVYDFMGLISLKKALPDSAVTAVLPEYPVGEPDDAELFGVDIHQRHLTDGNILERQQVTKDGFCEDRAARANDNDLDLLVHNQIPSF